MLNISQRTLNLGTENAFVVLAEVNKRKEKGESIVNFCIGQPDFDTPEHIKTAALQAMKDGKSTYTDAAGVYNVRKTVAKTIKRTRKIDVKPEDIVIANGAKPFIHFAISTLTDYGVGDEVLYPNPGFPIYEAQIRAQGAIPVAIPFVEKEYGFDFDIDILKQKINKKTKVMIINSPHNPTGAAISIKTYKEIVELIKKYDIWIYSDEPYSQLIYKYESTFSIASLPDMYERTLIVDSASKTYAMTGWRIGYAANPILSKHLSTWMSNTESCANHISQYALKAALEDSQAESGKMAKSFLERRDFIVELLNGIDGINCKTPEGAFYAYCNVTGACKKLGLKNSEEFRKALLNAGVAVLADIHFGNKNKGETQEYIRLSYATSKEQIKKGCDRIKELVGEK